MKLKGIWGLLKAAVRSSVQDNVPRLGAALSYYTLFAVSPLLIIVIFIASIFVSRASVKSALFAEVGKLLSQRGADAIQSALTAWVPHGQGLLVSVIAIVTLLVSATGVFIELQSDLNTIWGVEEKPGQGWRGFLKNRLLSFAMVLGIGFLLLVSLLLTAGLAAVENYFSARLPALHTFWLIVNPLASLAIITVLFALIFKVLPDVKIAWRDVWIGAVVTALLFTGGKFLLGFYLGRSIIVSAYGAAGSLVFILLWVYWSAQILFFGAELTQAYANQFGAQLEPKENARWIQAYIPPSKHRAAPDHPHASDHKALLVAELREEVEALRTVARRQRQS